MNTKTIGLNFFRNIVRIGDDLSNQHRYTGRLFSSGISRMILQKHELMTVLVRYKRVLFLFIISRWTIRNILIKYWMYFYCYKSSTAVNICIFRITNHGGLNINYSKNSILLRKTNTCILLPYDCPIFQYVYTSLVAKGLKRYTSGKVSISSKKSHLILRSLIVSCSVDCCCISSLRKIVSPFRSFELPLEIVTDASRQLFIYILIFRIKNVNNASRLAITFNGEYSTITL